MASGVFTEAGTYTTEANESICSMLLVTNAELLSKRITDILAEESSDSTSARLHRVAAGSAETFEGHHRRKNGSIINVEISLNYIKLRGIGHFFCFCRDISDRKRAEVVLREREAYFHLLADHMKDPVWLMDLNMKTIFRNPATYLARGYTLEDFQEQVDKNITPASVALATETFLDEMPRSAGGSDLYFCALAGT
ncbi:MAG: PAS domain-containing protein [Desulfobacterales bacterium]|nr:PAS domain-containing protein [Desulfobacterales bacterium]